MNLLEVHLPRPEKYYHISIPGEPMAWKRPGKFRHNASAKYQKHVADMVRAAVPGIQPAEGLWGARFAFFHGPRGGMQDWDNLAKNCCDALQDVIWKNDRQVRVAFVIMIPDLNPRTEMLFHPLIGPPIPIPLSMLRGEIL